MNEVNIQDILNTAKEAVLTAGVILAGFLLFAHYLDGWCK